MSTITINDILETNSHQRIMNLLFRLVLMYDIVELTDCYYTNATGTYNANLKTVTLSLTPTKSYECDVFPDGVVVTVKGFEIDHNIMWILDYF